MLEFDVGGWLLGDTFLSVLASALTTLLTGFVAAITDVLLGASA